MMTNPFNPADSAAMVTKSPPIAKAVKPMEAKELAGVPDLLKKRPIILPPKPPKAKGVKSATEAELKQGKIKVSDWSNVETLHSDGTVRRWGEDTTVTKNPNTLPKQMMPPPPVTQSPPPTKDLSDKGKGYSDYYYRKNQ